MGDGNNGLSLMGKILAPVILIGTVVWIIPLILMAMPLRDISLEVVLTLITVTLILVLIEIPLVLITLVHSILILVLVTILRIIVLIETGWSKEIVRTIAEKISVPLWLVTSTSMIVGTLSSINVLLSAANGGWTLGIGMWTPTSFTTSMNGFDLMTFYILDCLIHPQHSSRKIIHLFSKSRNVRRCWSDRLT